MNFSDTDPEVQKKWNNNSDQWAMQIRSGQDVYRHEFLEPVFMKFLGDIASLDVLDGGCGEGTSSRMLARAGARVSAIDLSQKMIENAKQYESEHPLDISYYQGSAAEMEFADSSFDLVTSWMALSDMSCYAAAMKEFSRVLRPGGRLMFCIRHPSYFTKRMGIVRSSETNPAGLLIGEYFNKDPWVENWAFSGGNDAAEGRTTFSNLRFPFTLSDCINGVLESGLVLRHIKEPTPDAEACARNPRLDFWRRHAALYLFISATKPTNQEGNDPARC